MNIVKCKNCGHWSPQDSHGFGEIDTIIIDTQIELIGTCSQLKNNSHRFEISLACLCGGFVDDIITSENFFCAEGKNKEKIL